jgi:hypothetical protein
MLRLKKQMERYENCRFLGMTQCGLVETYGEFEGNYYDHIEGGNITSQYR